MYTPNIKREGERERVCENENKGEREIERDREGERERDWGYTREADKINTLEKGEGHRRGELNKKE